MAPLTAKKNIIPCGLLKLLCDRCGLLHFNVELVSFLISNTFFFSDISNGQNVTDRHAL